MMDWNSIIITVLTVLISNGGIVTIATLREKKTSAFLDNVAKLMEEWKQIAEERKNRAIELKGDLDKKDDKIDSIYAELSKVRNDLDHARTDAAVSKTLKCEVTGCTGRIPPFGSNS